MSILWGSALEIPTLPVLPVAPGAYAYRPDETPPEKHKWGEDEAGFVRVPGFKGIVSKCPSSIDPTRAQALLDTGLGEHPARWPKSYPTSVWNVDDDGVVYRGIRTEGGRSYHGFPEWDVPPEVMPALEGLARQRGCDVAMRRWLRKTKRAIRRL